MGDVHSSWELWFPLVVNLFISTGVFLFAAKLIPQLKDKFIKSNLFGIDVNKKARNKV